MGHSRPERSSNARLSTADLAIVLGAGASVPPLVTQHDLVQKLSEAPDEPRIRPAQQYLRSAFPGFPNETIRFEDIAGPLEIAESEEYWYHFAGRESQRGEPIVPHTNKDVLDSLDTWVAVTLDPKELPKPPSSKDKEHERKQKAFVGYYAPRPTATIPYARLVWLLRERRLLEKTALISMNYDILLDRVLYASGTHVPDYAIDAFYETPETPAAEKEKRLLTRLLKLHGSLNWRVCDNCHILRDLRGFVVWPKSHCVDCGARTARPMLIRPTLLKDFRHRVWRDAWRAAGHDLARASTWIFVGYSLPLADVCGC